MIIADLDTCRLIVGVDIEDHRSLIAHTAHLSRTERQLPFPPQCHYALQIDTASYLFVIGGVLGKQVASQPRRGEAAISG